MFFHVDNPANPKIVGVVAPQELQSICEDFLQKNRIPYQVQECDKEKCVVFMVRERIDAFMLQFIVDFELAQPTDSSGISFFYGELLEIEMFLEPLFDYEHSCNYNALTEHFNNYLSKLHHNSAEA